MKNAIIFAVCLIPVWSFNPVLAGVVAAIIGGGLFFFRDPWRDIDTEDDSMVSPADGKVIGIEDTVFQDNGQRGYKITIFLSLFDVHVVRAASGGLVDKVAYKKGRFVNAFRHQASLVNENVSVSLRNGQRDVFIRMIAGKVTRKIVCFAQKGEVLKKGDKIGRIVFGSRVEIFIPRDIVSELKVETGNRVFAGETVICSLKPGSFERFI